MTQEEYRLEEDIKRWNIFFTLFFIVLCFFGFAYLRDTFLLPFSTTLFDALILVLAAFRIVRLLAYDNIMLFLREMFLDVKRVKYAETAEEHVERVLSASAFKRTIWKLLNCPWCLGVWVSLVVVFIYFAFPGAWVFFFLFAVAGVATFLQLLSSLIGWSAEHRKGMAEKNIEC